MNVQRISTLPALAALENDWQELQAEVPDTPIFLTWEWVHNWWDVYGKDRELWILTVLGHEGNLVGIAPLMITPYRFVIGIRSLSFIGAGVVSPDHLDLLAIQAESARVADEIANYLLSRTGDWDAIDFQSLSSESALNRSLSDQLSRSLQREPISCPFFTLPESWQDFEQQRLSANRRQQIRRYTRKLLQDHPDQVQFRRLQDQAEIAPALRQLVQLHKGRWGEVGKSTPFLREDFFTFHLRMAEAAHNKGWLRFYTLQVRDELIAAYYCFCYHGVIADYQSGFDPEWSAYRPGQVLLAYVVQKSIEEGAGLFDMLRGSHDYKSSWAEDVRQELHVMFSQHWRGHLFLLAAGLFERAKIWGRTILPTSWKFKLEKIVDRLFA